MAQGNAYSTNKALRYPDRIAAIRRGEPVSPVHVQVVLSDLCNQSCAFCSYRDPEYTSSQLFYTRSDGKVGLRKAGYEDRNYNPNRMIPTSKALEIIDDCAAIGVKAIQFTGGGEPTVHPDFATIASYTQAKGLKWALVTNGVNVTRKRISCSGASWVRVSIDAGLPETYSRIRSVPESHFYDAWAAVESIASSGPLLGVGFVVTPQNWREVGQAAAMAKAARADNFRISAQFSSDGAGRFSPFQEKCARLCEAAEELTDDSFTVFNRFSDRLSDLEQGKPTYKRCGYQEFTTYIGGDLNVYRCCVYSYNERGKVASLADARFRDVWMSQNRSDAMAEFDARGCERCQFNRINQTLDYVLNPEDPEHSEFV